LEQFATGTFNLVKTSFLGFMWGKLVNTLVSSTIFFYKLKASVLSTASRVSWFEGNTSMYGTQFQVAVQCITAIQSAKVTFF